METHCAEDANFHLSASDVKSLGYVVCGDEEVGSWLER